MHSLFYSVVAAWIVAMDQTVRPKSTSCCNKTGTQKWKKRTIECRERQRWPWLPWDERGEEEELVSVVHNAYWDCTVQARSGIPCVDGRSREHCIGTRMLLWEGNQILPAALLCILALWLLCFLEGLGHPTPSRDQFCIPLWENKAQHPHALTPTQDYSPARGRRGTEWFVERERGDHGWFNPCMQGRWCNIHSLRYLIDCVGRTVCQWRTLVIHGVSSHGICDCTVGSVKCLWKRHLKYP
jgi:hypothetical protein